MIDFDAMMQGRPYPAGWTKMDDTEKLDHVATRMLAEDRTAHGIKKHEYLREEGILSKSQRERRLRREVYSYDSVLLPELEGLSREQFHKGVFGRIHRKADRQREPWMGGDPIAYWGDPDD